MSRRGLSILALAGAGLLGGYLVFGSSAESQIAQLLSDALHAAEIRPLEAPAARAARISTVLETHFEPTVVIDVAGLGAPARGRAEVEALVLGLALRFDSAHFKIEQSAISVGADGADVTSTITLSARDEAGELRDTRQVTIRLVRQDASFRISAVSVGERSRAEPEARP